MTRASLTRRVSVVDPLVTCGIGKGFGSCIVKEEVGIISRTLTRRVSEARLTPDGSSIGH